MFDNHTRLFTPFAATLILATLVACNPQTVKRGDDGERKTRRVLAMVNDRVITTADFEREVETLPPDLKPLAHTVEGKEELLDTMIVRELIRQAAVNNGTGRNRGGATSAGLRLRETGEELKRSARIVIPEEDGVDGGDDDLNFDYRQLQLLGHYLDRALTGDDDYPR